MGGLENLFADVNVLPTCSRLFPSSDNNGPMIFFPAMCYKKSLLRRSDYFVVKNAPANMDWPFVSKRVKNKPSHSYVLCAFLASRQENKGGPIVRKRKV